MTKIQRDDFDAYMSDEEIWDTANQLLVDYFQFSKISNLKHRAYGVQIRSRTTLNPDSGVIEYDEEYINDCVRSAIWRTLHSVESDTEKRLGYGFTPKYRVDTIPFPRKGKFFFPSPGVEAINVQQTWSTIDGYDDEATNDYLITSATVDVSGDQATVRLPVDVVFNPEDVIIRDNATGSAFIRDNALPITRTAAATDYWNYPIKQTTTPYNGETINVQGIKYTYVDITPPTIPAGATLVPVYPGTNQIIPQYKDFETLVGGDYRFWFPVHVLVHPDFRFDTTVSLVDAEFYKLYPSIEFRYYEEETVYPELVVVAKNESGVVTEYTYQYDPTSLVDHSYPELKLIYNDSGLAHFVFNDETCDTVNPFELFPNADVLNPISVRLKLYYKTNPRFMEDRYQAQLSGLQRLIAQKVAAELPLADCGCKISKGFIAQQQTGYMDSYMNPFTGTTVEKFAYGNLHGQVAFEEFLRNVDYYRRPVFLG